MRRGKIYLRAGIGFMVLFMIAVYAITIIQTRHINNNMQISYHSASIKLINDIKRVEIPEDRTIASIMFSVNLSICEVAQQWSNMNMYSSILLLDENKEIITCSGNFLQCLSSADHDGRREDIMIPLNKYCSDEQSEQIYKELYDHSQGTGNYVQGEIFGYSDKWGLVPQKISIKNEGTEKNLMLEFNYITSDTQLDSFNINSAMLWVQGFGQQNRALTEKDRTIIKDCEAAGLTELRVLSANGYGTGTGGGEIAQFKYREGAPVKINGETCYLVIGVHGFPQYDAIISLIPIYIFLFVLMIILFIVVSQSFIRIYKQQTELENTRQDLINAVAHELKTPLGVIRNYSESLKEKINEDKREHYMDVIQAETERMVEMVSDMFTLSQLESGIKLTLQNHSLNHITEQVLERYRESIANKGIIVTIISPNDCVINCDAKLIEQVLSNFLCNAIQHTPENENINITINNIDEQTVFSIENSGQHIPADKISHIWDAFFKVDTARSNPNGTGLGLSIAKSILTAHNFEYGVKNTDSGVEFWFAVKT